MARLQAQDLRARNRIVGRQAVKEAAIAVRHRPRENERNVVGRDPRYQRRRRVASVADNRQLGVSHDLHVAVARSALRDRIVALGRWSRPIAVGAADVLGCRGFALGSDRTACVGMPRLATDLASTIRAMAIKARRSTKHRQAAHADGHESAPDGTTPNHGGLNPKSILRLRAWPGNLNRSLQTSRSRNQHLPANRPPKRAQNR
jgi:hypothetical protein